MQSRALPFNVELLKLTPARLDVMRPVTSIDFYETAGGDLHPDGLFSTPIFGRVGSEERDLKFSYIDIKLNVLHPVIYERLTKLKKLYAGILAGTHHVLWDPAQKDFVASDEIRGHTGFSYFLQHWKKIEFVRNDSAIRDLRIELIEKYRDRAMTNKIIVMPAGLRDIEVADDGRTTVGDINGIYRRLISIASTIPHTETMDTDPIMDRARSMLQAAFIELYKLIEMMVTGKKGFFQSKWASRSIYNSTRNVITASDLSTEYLGSKNAIGYTETIVGLHQASRALLPKVIFNLKQLVTPSFVYGDNRALLIDPKTLAPEVTEISPETFDRWMTSDGLEKVIASYGVVSLRDRPVMVDGQYLALIYRGSDMTFRILRDISELPHGFNKKHVHPITLVELLYLCMYRQWGEHYAWTTRYPVTGLGSMFPASLRVRTTITGEVRKELGDDWAPIDEDHIAIEYPVLPASSYLDSHVVNIARISGMGADF